MLFYYFASEVAASVLTLKVSSESIFVHLFTLIFTFLSCILAVEAIAWADITAPKTETTIYKMEFKLNRKYLLICVMNTQICAFCDDELWFIFCHDGSSKSGKVFSFHFMIYSCILNKYLLVYLKHITSPQLMCVSTITSISDTVPEENLVVMSHMCEQNIFILKVN